MFKVLVFLFCLFTPVLANSQGTQNNASDQQISDFSLAGYGEKGKKTWDLSGESADIFDEVVKLNNITGNMFGESEDIKLTADKGDFNKADGRVHLEDNVVITTSSGAKLTTDSLDWDRKNQLVTTKDMVNIMKEGMTTIATGALGEPNLNKMTLEKNVTVKIDPQPNEKKPEPVAKLNQIVITCDGPLEINYQVNSARFNNNVRAEKDDSVIFCDTMDIYFSRKSDKAPVEVKDKDKEPQSAPFMGSKIDKIVCRGNVKIIRGENVSYSEEAVYSDIDQKITLTGRPKLMIYSAEDFKNILTK